MKILWRFPASRRAEEEGRARDGQYMKASLRALLTALAVATVAAALLAPIASASGSTTGAATNGMTGGGTWLRYGAGGWMGLGGMWGGFGW